MKAATTASPSWRDALTNDERRQLLRTNNWRAWLSIGLDWGLVAASFALVAYSPGPLSILVALVVIGGRQLGFAVMMHEAAHHTLFANRALNDWAGNWLCAYPIWADLIPYRAYHLRHHAKNWTDEDPDLDLATKYPVTRASMGRKIWRDLSGQVAWKRIRATLARDLGGAATKSARSNTRSLGERAAMNTVGLHNLRGVILTNAVLLALLTTLGHPALYLLWVAAWLTTYSLVTRIRSIAEHNLVTDPSDELRNSRTTIARWWERLLTAPNRVNFHLEHHLLMTVPYYNLPRMHEMLRDRHALEGALVERGYPGILRRAAGAQPR